MGLKERLKKLRTMRLESGENRLPGNTPVWCWEKDCNWHGQLKDCPIIKDSNGLELPEYDRSICPKCGESVEGYKNGC